MPDDWMRAAYPGPALARADGLQLLVPGVEHRLPRALFQPAGIFSGRLEGLVTGLTATVLARALVGWCTLPPRAPVGQFWPVPMRLVLLTGKLV